MTRDELIAAITRDRATLDALVARVPADRMTEPAFDGGWSVKDVLAHIAAWEQLCLKWISENKRDELTAGPNNDDRIHALNARLHAEHVDSPLVTVRDEARRSYDHVVTAVRALSDTDLTSEPPWAPGRKLWQIISANSDDHYREHIDQIQRWLDGGPA